MWQVIVIPIMGKTAEEEASVAAAVASIMAALKGACVRAKVAACLSPPDTALCFL